MTTTRKTTILRSSAIMSLLVAISGCGTNSAATHPHTTTATSAPSVSAPSASASDDPYAKLPRVAHLKVTSTSVQDGHAFRSAQMSGLFGVLNGKDQSPQLTWTPGPAATKSYVVTMYDADAPTGSGFWHWAVYDIPATSHTLPAGAGTPHGPLLPHGSIQAPNDAGMPRYLGAAPPKGDPTHHYYLTVTALDIPRVPITATTSPALLGFTIHDHALARGDIIATATT